MEMNICLCGYNNFFFFFDGVCGYNNWSVIFKLYLKVSVRILIGGILGYAHWGNVHL